MIKLFSNIRQNILNEGKTTKYLKYAIGEIILVVTGILIALSINNYNEELTTDTKIKKSLIALRNDLIQDTFLIQQNLPEVNRQYELNESLRIRIAKKSASVDTIVQIARHEFNPNWNDPIVYNTNAYIRLNDSGLIENLPDSLKILIKNFYNKQLNYKGIQENITEGYKNKVSVYVDT